MSDYQCATCGYVTDDKTVAQGHYSSSLTVYRVTIDELQGICIGFKPGLTECDAFCLDEDNGGDFVHIEDGMVRINKLPEGAESDLMIWRTPDEFDEWAEGMDFHG